MTIVLLVVVGFVVLYGLVAFIRTARDPNGEAEWPIFQAAAKVEFVLGLMPLADITAEVLAAATAPEAGFQIRTGEVSGPKIIGFANDGTHIELYTSDGKATRLWWTIGPDGVASGIRRDQLGRFSRDGFLVSPTIAHQGPELLG